ncbi:transcriptional regulator, partial [Salmonella enterica]|nr:transcriptional regulator [Salmonella enterica]
METFEGFSLDQTDAFANISLLIEAGMLLAASTNGETEEVGDIVLDVAK